MKAHKLLSKHQDTLYPLIKISDCIIANRMGLIKLQCIC